MRKSANALGVISIFLGLLCLLLIPNAQGRTTEGPVEAVLFEYGTDSITGISGTSGMPQQATTKQNTTSTMAMRGLEWKEGGDLPCYMQTLLRSLQDGTKTPTGWYWQECPGENWGSEPLPGLKPRASGLRPALVLLLLSNIFPNYLFLSRAHTFGKVAVRPETLAP